MNDANEPWWNDAEEVLDYVLALHDSNIGVKPLSTDEVDEIHRCVLLRAHRIAHCMFPFLSRLDHEDLVQELMCKVVKNDVIAAIAGSGNAAYIAKVLRHALIDLQRKHQRHDERFEPLEESHIQRYVIVPNDEIRAIVAQAMVYLTAEEERIVILRFWEGLEIHEIADALGIKFSAAAKRLYRVLHKLHAILQSDEN